VISGTWFHPGGIAHVGWRWAAGSPSPTIEPVQRGRTVGAEEVSVARQASMRRRGDEGLSLVEVVIATAVLITVFIPVALLLQSGVKAVGGDINTNAASGVAASVLAQEQTAAGRSPSGPPIDTSSPPTPIYPEKAAKKWVSPALQTQKVGDVTYQIYGVGGWCVLSHPHTPGSPAVWTNAATAVTGTVTGTQGPAEYFVVVKVAWGASSTDPTSSSAKSVKEFSPLVSQPGWSVPTAANLKALGTANWCPVDPKSGVS